MVFRRRVVAPEYPDGIWYTDEVVAGKLAVDRSASSWATMLRLVVPVTAGDLLDVAAWACVTNDVGYTVGWHLWQYDVDDGVPAVRKVWRRISPSLGDNVDRPRHHLPLAIPASTASPPPGPRAIASLSCCAPTRTRTLPRPATI